MVIATLQTRRLERFTGMPAKLSIVFASQLAAVRSCYIGHADVHPTRRGLKRESNPLGANLS